ncbi:ATP-binding protein [Belliella sp. DSM 111904]|uniref:histidine kinase n=1 Tax=Belliella filtrata TaxID=2923435 RepID=A0ABS9V449_9BACT|nr:ATP-binding protein [Belliella filtrata]MCH7411185.1 ATP-binding protein [Belliella filtrata]
MIVDLKYVSMKDRGINNTFKKVIYESSDMVFLADDTYPYNIFYSNLAFDNSIGDLLMDKSLVGLGLDVNSYIFKEEMLISFQSNDYRFQVELPKDNDANYFLFYNGKEIKKQGLPAHTDINSFFESDLDLIAIGKENFLTWINPTTLRTLGYAQEELINVDLCHFFHPEELHDFRSKISNLSKENGSCNDLIIRIQRKDQVYREISWSVKFKDGSFYATGRDVTEQRSQYQLTKNVTELVPGTFFQFSIGELGEIEIPYLSAGITDILGLEDSSIDQAIDFNLIVSKIHHEDIAQVMSSAMSSSKLKQPWTCEFRLKTLGDKSFKWLKVNAKLADSNNGKLDWYGYLSDISDQKEKEQMLQNQREMAINSSKIKSEFLSTISHDLRTPLNAITGSIYSLLQEVHTPAQKAAFDTINFSVENLIIMINDLLDFQKLEAGKLSLDPQPMELREVVSHVMNSFESHAEESKNALNLHFDHAANLTVLGDKVRVTQILNNLISNALKFTNEGSVDVSVKLKFKTEDKSSIYFEVKDTGIGIASEDVVKIFQDFDQIQQTFSKKYGGTGLGLSISKKLLEQMDSEIKVSSELGKGSVFFFEITFDNVKNVPVIESFPMKVESNLVHSVNILMAEDNDVNALVLGKILKKWGYEFERVTNGQEALDAIRNGEFDIVLMDIQMPIMDGFQSTTKIKEVSNIPVIALTAAIEQDILNEIEAIGFDEYVSKPIDAEELHKKINDILAVPHL